MNTNLLTDIQSLNEAGYDSIEASASKLERYLDAGYRVEELLPALGSLQVNMIGAVYPTATEDLDERTDLMRRLERLCAAAQVLGCPAIQVVAYVYDGPVDSPWPDIRSHVARTLRPLAELAANFKIRLALENIVGTPVDSLGRALEVIEATDVHNVTLIADTFHLWTSGTRWEEVAELDPDTIESVHISDSIQRKGPEWLNDPREALPGDGVVPLVEGIAAIRATGYDRIWTAELFSLYHSEWPVSLLAQEVKRRMDGLLGAANLSHEGVESGERLDPSRGGRAG
jgi:sugar phosphate isomerase/epimerase